jgi:RNA-binding protein
MSLSNAQLRYLRGLCHDLKPVIYVGQKGLSDNLLAELEAALAHHELVKVKIQAEDRSGRDEIGESLATRTGAEMVQRVGHVVCLFRRNPEKQRIELPG